MGHQAGAEGRLAQVRHGLRRHERGVAAGYLAIVVGVLLLWLVPEVRAIASDQARRFTSWSDLQWVERVDAAVGLLEAGRHADAEVALVKLDRRLPARHIKHGLAGERARVLEGLARTYWAQDRKRRTLETLDRLTAFEPRNFGFHALHAEAAAAFGELDEARDARGRVLAIHPNHLATVREVVRDHAERGDAAGAVDAYEAYLDAFGPVPIHLRGDPIPLQVPADGMWHALSFGVAGKPSGHELSELTADAPFEARALVIRTPRLAGSVSGTQGAESLSYRISMQVRAFKPVDPELWEMVLRACRNLTAWDRLDRLEARTRVEAEPRDPFAGDPT